jgi:hypothetical protein
MSFIPEFCKETEALLLSCINPLQTNYPESTQTLRNHFTNLFLKRFLPSTIQIGSGEIVDNFGTRSSHQNLILYRTDFPIFPTNSESKTFLMESVLATIEILPPSTSRKGIAFTSLECFAHLTQPFTNSASVKNLRTAKHRIFADNSRDHIELSSRLKPKTFLFSFEPKVDHQSFYDNYSQAKQATLSVVPDGICIPGSTGLYARYDPYHRNTNFHTDEPFIHFFKHLFQILVGEINSHNWQLDNNASIKYNLSNYLHPSQPSTSPP